MILSASSRAELNWWIFNVDTSHKHISHGEPKLHIQTDASTHGWGVVRGEQRTGGRWNQQEASHHINYLELLAVLLTIKALCGECANLHIRVQCDNTTAVCYINNMGCSKSPDCNSVTRQIWDYCVERNILISVHTCQDVKTLKQIENQGNLIIVLSGSYSQIYVTQSPSDLVSQALTCLHLP